MILTKSTPEVLQVKSLEAPLTEHCNLKCAGCNQASPHMEEKSLAVKELARDLSVLTKVMKTNEFKVLGGEPLQHPELDQILEVIRKSEITRKIVLVTNGMLLHRTDAHIWKSIDKIWLSIYPNVRLKWALSEIEAQCKKHDVQLELHPSDQFRRAVINQEITDSDLVQKIYDNCKSVHAWKCYTVVNGRFFKCSKATLIKKRLAITGTAYKEVPRDGVELHPHWFLRQRLERYLASKTPLGACRYCLGTSGPSFNHHQMKRAELKSELLRDETEAIEFTRSSIG